MRNVEEARETIPGSIRLDRATGFPLITEQEPVLGLIRAYLQLPYSVAEHGCGKKTNLILDHLVRMGVPIWALRRGMVLERDMSPEALAQHDADRRPHRLLVDNPLCALGDLSEPTLRAMLDEANTDVSLRERAIQAGQYRLHYEPTVQFVIARSHIYPIVTFWDEEHTRAVDLVVDPTLRREQLFDVSEIRALCHASEALLFEAQLGGRFRLDTRRLTVAQRDEVKRLLAGEQEIDELAPAAHAELVRGLTGAEPGSIGDPETWTYANNVSGEDLLGELEDHDRREQRETGAAQRMRGLVGELVTARVNTNAAKIEQRRQALIYLVESDCLAAQIRRDAVWAERHLEPLARVAITMVYHRSLCSLGHTIDDRGELLEFLASAEAHRQLRGLGVRQRRRIDRLAVASEDTEGRIDARALSGPYIACVVETIRQMNDAGLSVCVDRVGNIHGLRLDESERRRLRDGLVSVAELVRTSVVLGSHIDTVTDAGRFDGRLGVTAGLEVAHVIRDLERYRGVRLVRRSAPIRLLVTAFVGEEMTFTGQGVSMPGSAAVAGLASVQRVHDMRNAEGERFGDRLQVMLQALREAQAEGTIELMNLFSGRDSHELVDACYEPVAFFTPHSLERHIEQGPILDRAGVPMALVDRIMGIHQEDFDIRGARAEAAALEFDVRLREVVSEEGFGDARITVGIIEPTGDTACHVSGAALRCVLAGETNHAGATPMADRRDAGVAAGRLVRALAQWITECSAKQVSVEVGDVSLEPGSNRNVIPGRASLTLAVSGGTLTDADVDDLQRTLAGVVAGGLSRVVGRMGEGLVASAVTPTSFVNVANRARMTLDLRDADQATLDRLIDRVGELVREIERTHAVVIERAVQQRFPPQDIEESGQVLLMERSYGGSHNPKELELTMDLARACVLQLSVLQEVLNRDTLDGMSLVQVVDRHLPLRWRQSLRRLVSGALHDTCNIAVGAKAKTTSGCAQG